MTDEEFDQLLQNLSQIKLEDLEDPLHQLSILAKSSEIRDFEWKNSTGFNLLSFLMHSLYRIWKDKRQDLVGIETKILHLWGVLACFPEHEEFIKEEKENISESETGKKNDEDLEGKSYSSLLKSSKFHEKLTNRIIGLSFLISDLTDQPNISGLRGAVGGGVGETTEVKESLQRKEYSQECLTKIHLLQQLFLFIYQQNLSLRTKLRNILCQKLLQSFDERVSNVGGQAEGQSRPHVASFLEILQSILSGLKVYSLEDCLLIKVEEEEGKESEEKENSREISSMTLSSSESDTEEGGDTFSIAPLPPSSSKIHSKGKQHLGKSHHLRNQKYLEHLSSLFSKDSHPLSTRRSLFFKIFRPLHDPSGFIIWRDQVPVIQSYHAPLSACICLLIDKEDKSLRKFTADYFGIPSFICKAKAKNFLPTNSEGKEREEEENTEKVYNGTSFHLQRGDSNLMILSIRSLLYYWPEGKNAATNKIILFIHELEMLLERCLREEFIHIQDDILSRLAHTIGSNSDNIRPAQKVLQMLNKAKVKNLFLPSEEEDDEEEMIIEQEEEENKKKLEEIQKVKEKTLRVLMPHLYKSGGKSWNPTLNKMIALTLNNFREANLTLFKSICEDLCTYTRFQSKKDEDAASETKSSYSSIPPQSPPNDPSLFNSALFSSSSPLVSTFPGSSIFSMPLENIIDTSRVDHAPPRFLPPKGAITNPISRSKKPEIPSKFMTVKPPDLADMSFVPRLSKSGVGEPPVTVTGVAPWAIKKEETKQTSSKITDDALAKESALAMTSKSGYEIMLSYMRQCYPEIIIEENIEEEREGSEVPKKKKKSQSSSPFGNVSSWHQQNSENFVKLDDVLFHDLVFGQQLGSGSFSTVKYARKVVKGQSQSQWPEYAVKIINNETVVKFDYSLLAMRELIMLQTLQHPCLSRLLTSFTFLNNIYLVLEYAKYGDLHSFLIKYHHEITNKKKFIKKKSSQSFLSHNLIRFITSQILTAVEYIHMSGFAHNDLKTENILIVGNGHVKITDFGACRPINQEKKDLLKSRLISFNEVRDGHWRVRKCGNINDEIIEQRKLEREKEMKENEAIFDFENIKRKIEENDERCEGTPSYLPPEKLFTMLNIGENKEKINNLLNNYNFNLALNENTIKNHFLNQKNNINNLLDCYNDYWSLGCIIKFCYDGHPLFYGEKEEVFKQMITWVESKDKESIVKFEGNSLLFNNNFNEPFEEQDRICESFINSFLSIDINNRMTVSEALSHPYILYGYATPTSSLNYPHNEDNNMIEFEPRNLHKESRIPVEWPQVLYSDSSKSGEDPQWARRQFSTLWAPLPSSYSLNTKVNTASTSKMKFVSLSGISLISVEETDVEAFSQFY